jgi:predicted aspartyl protease
MVPMTFEGLNNLKGYIVVRLLDSGATNGFMSQQFVDKHGIEVEPLAVAVPVYNADGCLNKGGRITHVAHMRL